MIYDYRQTTAYWGSNKSDEKYKVINYHSLNLELRNPSFKASFG